MIHLVIADVKTINHILHTTTKLELVDDTTAKIGDWLPWEHVAIGDLWQFRTPRSDAVMADYAYINSFRPSLSAAWQARMAVSQHTDPQARILPLIAACDLLEIDQL
jgi:hypothetical protein